MLVSTLNMLLRDREFESLDDICGYFDIDRADLDSILASAGYTYDEQQLRVI